MEPGLTYSSLRMYTMEKFVRQKDSPAIDTCNSSSGVEYELKGIDKVKNTWLCLDANREYLYAHCVSHGYGWARHSGAPSDSETYLYTGIEPYAGAPELLERTAEPPFTCPRISHD